MSAKDKWVRRFSVDKTAKHKNGFTIYKITSVLFPIASPETVTVVSVWKRYSEAQRLHRATKALHAGLRLKGTFPALPGSSYFKRFQHDVILERARAIKTLLEFIAGHKLLFTSTDFVNFLQTGYAEPESSTSSSPGVINAIRSSLHLPVEDTPPIEYRTDDDDSPEHRRSRYPDPEPSTSSSPGVPSAARSPRSPRHPPADAPPGEYRTDEDDSPEHRTEQHDYLWRIPVHHAVEVERRQSPKQLSTADSLESLTSLDGLSEEFFSELNKVTIDKNKQKPCVKVLPDLIIFDAPSASSSQYGSYNSNLNSETVSLSSVTTEVRSRALSLSNIECKTKTEDSYVFEAGYMLNLAARYEDMNEYHRAFECYKAGIEKMLIGVQSDTDPQRRALIKEKTNKYLSYAETIYKNHLCDAEQSLVPERCPARPLHCPLPLSLLSRPYEELSLYRVLAVLGSSVMLVLHSTEQTCYAMKVIQKVPNNLMEFDEYFPQNINETRTPILPTVIPYMVQLHSYIQTNNLIFLILSYAPGQKLFEYIKTYAKSLPNTPAREVNLENVFTEPKMKNINDYDSINNEKEKNRGSEDNDLSIDCESDLNYKSSTKTDIASYSGKNDKPDVINIVENQNINIRKAIDERTDIANDNIDSIIEIKKLDTDIKLEINEVDSTLNINPNNETISIIERIEANIQNNNKNIENKKIDFDNTDNLEVSVNELVINSQKLLLDVDKALTEVPKMMEVTETSEVSDKKPLKKSKVEEIVVRRVETPVVNKTLPGPARDVLPPSAMCKWGAQIVTALESLHNCGVICRDLNPSNILLGDRGQIILTYFVSYPGIEMTLSKLRSSKVDPMYIAPELFMQVCEERDHLVDRACDYWSFGVVMYELLCGVPLSRYHRSAFTSHTTLYLPDGLTLEEESLLTELLTADPATRLGSSGVEEVKKHPYFKHIDWQHVYDSWALPD